MSELSAIIAGIKDCIHNKPSGTIELGANIARNLLYALEQHEASNKARQEKLEVKVIEDALSDTDQDNQQWLREQKAAWLSDLVIEFRNNGLSYAVGFYILERMAAMASELRQPKSPVKE